MKTLREMTQDYVLSILNAVNKDKVQASKVLGISTKTLYNMLERYNKKEEYRKRLYKKNKVDTINVEG